MANYIFNPSDVYIIRRNATSSSYEEYKLTAGPNRIVIFDSDSNIISIANNSLQVGTSSLSISSISSSYTLSASYAPDSTNLSGLVEKTYFSSSTSIFAGTASYTLTASYASEYVLKSLAIAYAIAL